MLTCPETAALLRQWDKILVMSHASPDGDTLGSASALLRGLSSLGKQVDFLCADPVPEKFSYLFAGLPLGGFEPAHVMTVDVADKALLGKAPQELVARVELAIDHHGTHVPFAPQRWVEADSAATVELIYALLGELGVELDRAMADCLYTGLATDTGCFPLPERHPPDPPHRGGTCWSWAPKAGISTSGCLRASPGPGGGRAHCHGQPGLLQPGLGGHFGSALYPLRPDRRGGKRPGRHRLPPPGDPRGGAGRHPQGESRRQGEGFRAGQSPGGRFPAVQPSWRRRPSGGPRDAPWAR